MQLEFVILLSSFLFLFISLSWEREGQIVSGVAKHFIATTRGPRPIKTEVCSSVPRDFD